MRKVVIILLVVMLCAGGAAIAAWRISDDGGDKNNTSTNSQGSSFQNELEETVSADNPLDSEAGQDGEATAADVQTGAVDNQTGEDFSYTSPDQRYVTETQRHQNFLRAVAEGRVTRLQVISADVRPVGDPDTSYIYISITSDGGISNGTFVMKFENGMWRIAAINQLSGSLEGGTNYMVPASFDEELGREIAELQPFLTKVAEGRFSYMEVHGINHPSENETVLTGVVVGVGGTTVPAEMRLRRDYGIWHITYITDPP